MFLVGLGFRRDHFRANAKSAAAVSLAGMAAPFLERHLGGGQIIVVNKPGAGGMLMLNDVAAAAPDGRHVALVSFPALVTALYDNTPRYRVESFAYVGLLTDEPYTVFVGTDSILGPVYLGYGKAEDGPDQGSLF